MKIIPPLRTLKFPVFCERKPNNPNDLHYPIFDSENGCVAHVFSEQLAQQFVRAFNSHDELVAALTNLWDCLETWAKDSDSVTPEKVLSLRQQSRHALRRAKGEV